MISLALKVFRPGFCIIHLNNTFCGTLNHPSDVICILRCQCLKLSDIVFLLQKSPVTLIPNFTLEGCLRDLISLFFFKMEAVQISLPVKLYKNKSYIKHNIFYHMLILLIFLLIYKPKYHPDHIAHDRHKKYCIERCHKGSLRKISFQGKKHRQTEDHKQSSHSQKSGDSFSVFHKHLFVKYAGENYPRRLYFTYLFL